MMLPLERGKCPQAALLPIHFHLGIGVHIAQLSWPSTPLRSCLHRPKGWTHKDGPIKFHPIIRINEGHTSIGVEVNVPGKGVKYMRDDAEFHRRR